MEISTFKIKSRLEERTASVSKGHKKVRAVLIRRRRMRRICTDDKLEVWWVDPVFGYLCGCFKSDC